jgi:hypothetical protein
MEDTQIDKEVKKTYNNLAKNYVNNLEYINFKNVVDNLLNNYKKNYDYKFFQIKDNNLYLITEQPYSNEIRLEAAKCHLLNILKKYKLPDMEFIYFDGDSLDTKDPVLVSTSCSFSQKQILIPDFMFKFSPNVNMFDYFEESNKILFHAKENGIVIEKWKNRINKIFYRGSVNTKYRKNYLNLDKNIFDVEHVNAEHGLVGKPNYNPNKTLNSCTREYKTKFKYLLQLNGHEDTAYSSSFRFNLACCSLVFYASNNPQKEWWMDDSIFKHGIHYVGVNNLNELNQAYRYFESNQEKAFEIAKNGYDFFKKWLNSESVEYFYYKLLLEYSKKLKYNINLRQDAKLITSYEKYNENSK